MKMTIEERNAFIEKNAGIIGEIIHKPFKKKSGNYKAVAELSGYSYDDLFNTGVIGMIEGIENYTIEKATKEDGRVVPLEAFVHWDIRRTISEFIATPRKHDLIENKVSMDQKLFNDDGSSTTVGDQIAGESHTEEFGASIDHENIRALLDSDILSDVEKIAIKARFMDGLVLREINEILAKHLGNPKAKAFYFINTALAKLRNALEVA